MGLLRNNRATLRHRDEVSLVDNIVRDLQSPDGKWKCDGYCLVNTKWEIWITNRPYDDMCVYSPFKVTLGFWQARRLRAFCDVVLRQIVANSMRDVRVPMDVLKAILR